VPPPAARRHDRNSQVDRHSSGGIYFNFVRFISDALLDPDCLTTTEDSRRGAFVKPFSRLKKEQGHTFTYANCTGAGRYLNCGVLWLNTRFGGLMKSPSSFVVARSMNRPPLKRWKSSWAAKSSIKITALFAMVSTPRARAS
jgi:hypothetical protein